MSELTKIQKMIRANNTDVRITFHQKINAITYSTNNALGFRVKGGVDTRTRGFQKASITSVAEANHAEGILLLNPFDFGKTSGIYEMKESTVAILHYWKLYAEIMNLNTIQLDIPLHGESLSGFWPNGGRILTARELGFQINEIENIDNQVLYKLESRVSEYDRLKNIVNDINRVLKEKNKIDKTFLYNPPNEFQQHEIVKLHENNPPFFSVNVNWEGFDGYICFEEVQEGIQVCIHAIMKKDNPKTVATLTISNAIKKSHLETIFSEIQDYREMLNVFRVPCANLSRFITEKFSSRIAEKNVESIMELFLQKGYSYQDVESEIIGYLESKDNKKYKRFEFFQGQGFYLEILNEILCITWELDKNEDVRVECSLVKTQEEMIAFFQKQMVKNLIEKTII